MPPLLLKLVFDRIPRGVPALIRPVARLISKGGLRSFVQPQIERHLDYLEAELATRPWFAGEEFTAADIQMSFPLEAAQTRGGLDASRPKLTAFLQNIQARPAYQRALERGGKYELLG